MKFWIGLAAGIAAGVTVGILFAPARGSVTRRRIVQTAGDLADTSREKVHDFSYAAKRKARNFTHVANQKVQKASDFARDKADDIGQAVGSVKSAITEKFQRVAV